VDIEGQPVEASTGKTLVRRAKAGRSLTREGKTACTLPINVAGSSSGAAIVMSTSRVARGSPRIGQPSRQ